jgi:hypothetical protein
MMVMEDSKVAIPNRGTWAWVDAWAGAMMNMWNPELVRANYPEQIKALLVPGPSGTISVNPGQPFAIGDHRVVGDACDLGWVAAWVSEMGDESTREGLLAHADRYLKPKWRDGGLYYPRNDVEYDADGVRTMMEPLTGNVLLGYARLNVPDGLWKLYNEPWAANHFRHPALTRVAGNVDVMRANFDDEAARLFFSVQAHADLEGDSTIELSNLDCTANAWTLYEDDKPVATSRNGVLDANAIGLRKVGDRYELVCADDRARKYTVEF